MNGIISEKSKNLPHLPGVYIFKNRANKVIYVGKANDLKKRVSSYGRGNDNRYQIPFILKEINDIDFIVTRNQTEAFLLEDTLIKKHKPKYNIQLKDDKTYVSIEFTMRDEYPGVYVIRRKSKKEGSLVLGPFSSASSVRSVLNYLIKIFPVRTCSDSKMQRYKDRPCIYYQLGKCSAPCVRYIEKEDYMKLVNDLVDVIHGKTGKVVKDLEKRINSYSSELEFEKAALYRDRLYAIRKLMEKQSVVVHSDKNADYIGWYVENDVLSITRFVVREGRLIDRDNYIVSPVIDIEDTVLSYVYQLYRISSNIPENIYIEMYHELLNELFAGWSVKIKIKKPHFKIDKDLLIAAVQNSKEKYLVFLSENREKEISKIKDLLKLKNLPKRMECIDISEFAGKELYGSCVVFKNGKPWKDQYRIYSIKSVEGIDDFSMIAEVVKRRLEDDREKPDLLVIDGGKGQLSSALKILNEMRLEKDIDLVSIAKDRGKGKGERIFIPGRSNPILLDQNDPAARILINIRDEAHRFVIKHNRKKRVKGIKSSLLEIEGIGEKRAKRLLEKYDSVNELKNADTEELKSILKISEEKAERIKEDIKNLFS